MRGRIHERELIMPALQIMLDRGGKITTSGLIVALRAVLQPCGEDLAILEGRSDDKFSQIVRNLRSHRTFERLGLARYAKGAGEFIEITKYGRRYMAKHTPPA